MRNFMFLAFALFRVWKRLCKFCKSQFVFLSSQKVTRQDEWWEIFSRESYLSTTNDKAKKLAKGYMSAVFFVCLLFLSLFHCILRSIPIIMKQQDGKVPIALAIKIYLCDDAGGASVKLVTSKWFFSISSCVALPETQSIEQLPLEIHLVNVVSLSSTECQTV